MRKFIGIGRVNDASIPVARFEIIETGYKYYMQLDELCDWIEHQMSSGTYYTARDAINVDRQALLALIEVQRKLLAAKIAIDLYPTVSSDDLTFADFMVLQTNAEDGSTLII